MFDLSFLFGTSPWVGASEILVLGIITSLVLYFLIGWIFQLTGVERVIYRFLGHSARI